jgi:hypothetical protein
VKVIAAGLPRTSSALHPKIDSAPGDQLSMLPSGLVVMMA